MQLKGEENKSPIKMFLIGMVKHETPGVCKWIDQQEEVVKDLANYGIAWEDLGDQVGRMWCKMVETRQPLKLTTAQRSFMRSPANLPCPHSLQERRMPWMAPLLMNLAPTRTKVCLNACWSGTGLSGCAVHWYSNVKVNKSVGEGGSSLLGLNMFVPGANLIALGWVESYYSQSLVHVKDEQHVRLMSMLVWVWSRKNLTLKPLINRWAIAQKCGHNRSMSMHSQIHSAIFNISYYCYHLEDPSLPLVETSSSEYLWFLAKDCSWFYLTQNTCYPSPVI